MLFNSIPFFLFFPIVFVIYYLLPGRFRWSMLLLASVAFYMYASVQTVFVPIVITICSFACGVLVEKNAQNNKGKFYYVIGIILNLGLLLFYKYINFILGNICGFIKYFNNTSPFVLNYAMPIGISYITFQAVGYLTEIRKGNQHAEKNMGHFAAYIFFFPKLLSGPIERAHNFLPQLHGESEICYENVADGAKRFLLGLLKKLVVADRLAIYTNAVLGNAEHHKGATLAIASLFYTVQLYADFSGYTDMALGIAKMLGFKMAENFELPFFAKTMTEFWRRWHMSLTSWITDYIYNPLVFKLRKLEKYGVMLTSVLTLTVIGLWHGANWTFIIFGLLHGLMISVELLLRKSRRKFGKKYPRLESYLGMLFVFVFFTFTLVFFKAESVNQAFIVLKGIVHFKGPVFYESLSVMMLNCVVGALFIVSEIKKGFYKESFSFFNNKSSAIRCFSYVSVCIIILLFGVFDGGQYIYFQF